MLQKTQTPVKINYLIYKLKKCDTFQVQARRVFIKYSASKSHTTFTLIFFTPFT